ncbi:MAG: AAA family ATPase [Eubacteriales bacterium]|nr:AAA family ATPase [Eubacteriales bacterium]
MNIKRAKQEIKDTIAAYLKKDEFGAYVIPSIRQRPLLLIGPPGVGKTQIMEQISQECRIGLVAYTITHHTRQSAIGLPFIEKKQYGQSMYQVTEYTMSEIVASVYDKIEQTGIKEGILFIDEINCVSETLAPAMLQLLQGKSFGNHRLPEGWIIAAAGNPPEYNKSVRDFDIVTLDRIRRLDVEPDYEAWKEYAAASEIHPAVQEYLSVRSQNFCRIETTVDGRLFATPRGWEDLSQLIQVYETMRMPVDRELIQEYIQFPKIAKDFANYLELHYKYKEDYQVDRILAGEISEAAVDKLQRASFDERISVVGLLLSGLNREFARVSRMGRMMERRMRLFRDLKEKGLSVKAFSEMADGFQEQLEREKEQGLVSRMDYRTGREVCACLEEDLRALQNDGCTDEPQIWDLLRQRFGRDSDSYEALVQETGQKLEHGFDFMEAAFGGSQEMVLFVTELNTGFYSVEFLKEYSCGRYYQYNKNLLFSEGEQEIGEMISRMEKQGEL